METIKIEEEIRITKQMEILNLNRSTYYFKEKKESINSSSSNIIKLEIDKLYIKYPFYGHRKMQLELKNNNINIGRDKTLKLMNEMGIQVLYPKKKTSIRNKNHKVYPYLLRDLDITKSNQVWSCDITYIPTIYGYCYMVGIIDWFSKKILSYRISNTMDKQFCIDALTEAIELYGNPEIFNTDQGSQFTSQEFTTKLIENNIKISMDSKGRAIDNIVIERFWRSIKYENIYLNKYQTIKEVKSGVKDYILFYNTKRWHFGINKLIPDDLYYQNIREAA